MQIEQETRPDMARTHSSPAVSLVEDMAQTHSSSAGAKEATGEPPSFETWTSEGYYRRTSLPGAAKFEDLLQKTKGINVSSLEGVEHAVHRIKLARQDVVFIKSARTLMVLGVVVAGFTLGASWVAPLPERKEQVKKIQQ